ncbi:MAG: FixH family protein [Siculibacillus sp.]
MPTDLNGTNSVDQGGFRLTGTRVLIIFVVVFGVVFGVNGYMLYKAVGTFSGTVTDSSYRVSQGFNKEIAAAQAQAERAWQVSAHAERADDGVVSIRVEARTSEGRPVSGVAFRARLQHPAATAHDKSVDLAPLAGADGVFTGRVADVGQGKWGLAITGDTAEGRAFASQNTLFFK